MRELMLELLTYEPYGKFLPVEKIYIDDILSGNCQQPQPMLHDLFSGFHQYVQRANFEEKSTRDTMKADMDWLLCWKNTYHQNKNYTHSSKAGRIYYPLLFKKICFYIIVRKKFTDKEFMGVLGLPVNHISKWGISTKFRRYAETNSYSIVRTFRAGAKKPYIVSLVKKLYYEAGRQDQEGQDSQKSKQSKKSKSMTLKKLPTFVDVFAGTASVAASMVSKGCPPPIVNDYDIVMVCFAWAFTYYQHEIRREIVEFHNYLRRDLKLTDCSYDEAAYERHNEKIAPGNLLTDPNAWDDLSPRNLWLFTVVYKYSKKDIEDRKRFAQRHQEFIMRIRSGYKDVGLVLKSCNRSALRDIDFNNRPLPKDMNDPQKGPILRDILDYALALFFYYSFAPQQGRIYHEIIVDVDSYLSFLSSLKVDLSAVRTEDQAVTADDLLKLRLKASSLKLESTGNFSRHLKGAKFYCKPFEDILKFGSDKIYYLDSPYFLTTEYDVKFSDDDHKAMLDILRDATFRWIFSMQYNQSSRDWCSGKRSRKNQPYIIKDYGAYYRGFYAPFQLEADQKTYVAADAPIEDAKSLYAILFDFDKVKMKWPEMKIKTKEMLVVNFNCLRTIPLHDSAVVLPFNLFLQCADKEMDYEDIVQQAITWRKRNITNNFAGKTVV